MKIIISNSAKSLGVLYHGTTKERLVSILRTGKLELASGRLRESEDRFAKDRLFYGSFTRSRNCSYLAFAECNAILEVDGDALSNSYKIEPIDYFDNPNAPTDILDSSRRSEAEERLLSDTPQLPILKYIRNVYFIQAGNIYNPKPMIMQHTDSANIEGQGMASILLLLKKNKIPYSFYPSIKDWQLKRSEFSAVISPTVERTRKVRSVDKAVYTNMVALLHCLQGTMTAGDKQALTTMLSNTLGLDTFLVNLLDNTNASLYNQQNNTAVLATKVVRLIKRMGLKSRSSIKYYISSNLR